MTLREFFWENLVGDLEYHPRRAIVYLSLSGATLCVWIFTAYQTKFTVSLGGLTLLLKGVFFLRKSSEALGLSPQQLADLSESSHRKALPSIPMGAAELLQVGYSGDLYVCPRIR